MPDLEKKYLGFKGPKLYPFSNCYNTPWTPRYNYLFKNIFRFPENNIFRPPTKTNTQFQLPAKTDTLFYLPQNW